jgi:hypothetical protein
LLHRTPTRIPSARASGFPAPGMARVGAVVADRRARVGAVVADRRARVGAVVADRRARSPVVPRRSPTGVPALERRSESFRDRRYTAGLCVSSLASTSARPSRVVCGCAKPAATSLLQGNTLVSRIARRRAVVRGNPRPVTFSMRSPTGAVAAARRAGIDLGGRAFAAHDLPHEGGEVGLMAGAVDRCGAEDHGLPRRACTTASNGPTSAVPPSTAGRVAPCQPSGRPAGGCRPVAMPSQPRAARKGRRPLPTNPLDPVSSSFMLKLRLPEPKKRSTNRGLVSSALARSRQCVL